MANTFLQRTQSATESDSKKATISAWVKIGGSLVGNFNAGIFGTHVSGNYGADGNTQIGFYNGGLYAWFKEGGVAYYKQESTRRFRDHNAWYHLVYRFDTTETTASNRIRVYVNNEEITSWSVTNNPGLNQNIQMNNGGRILRVGTYNFTGGTPNDFDGCMSHYHFCDGQSYAPTEFGEYDANGVWKIKTSPSVTYGNNGFLILKDGNSVTDQSGNSNNLTVAGGTLTKTEDNPSNVFATLNPLMGGLSSVTYSNGNTTATFGAAGTWYFTPSTLAASQGKYYAEVKVGAVGGETSIGIIPMETVAAQQSSASDYMGKEANSIGYVNNGNIYKSNSVQESVSTYTAGDIIGIAFDLTGNSVQFYKNGTSVGSAVTLTSGLNYTVGVSGYTSSVCNVNFGNGYFGTTAVASAGTNASGIGIFEYDVPTGFTALSTKGLNL